MILGGTIFELLEHERGPDACQVLVSRLRRGGWRATLELAFDQPWGRIERGWREYLRELPGRHARGDELDDALDGLDLDLAP